MNVATPSPRLKAKLSSPKEERANDLGRRRELGQFFTPARVAEFTWDFLELIHGGLFPPNTRLIDPACGEGVFLRVAQARGGLPAGGLFGADIDAALAAAWRRDPLLAGTHLRLMNGLTDDSSRGIQEETFDLVAGNPPFSGKGLRELLRLLADVGDGEEQSEPDLFGAAGLNSKLVAAREPLSPQMRAELDRLVRSLSQYACWRLDSSGEPDMALEGDSDDLFGGQFLNDKPRPTAADCDRAARIIAQWPADRLLDVSRPEIREVIRRLASTAIEVFFTERFVRLARPGGLVAVIVPESIVASDRLGPLRRWLAQRVQLLASISLPQKVFTGVGANAKTTILFLRRTAPELDRVDPPEPDDGQDRLVLMTAPATDPPGWSLDRYLDDVLRSAREDRTFDGSET